MSFVHDILNDDSRRQTIHLTVSAIWTVASAILTGVIVHGVTEGSSGRVTMFASLGIIAMSAIWIWVEHEITKRQSSKEKELDERARKAEVELRAAQDERSRLLVDANCGRMVIRDVSALLDSATTSVNSILHEIEENEFGWMPKDFFESKCQSVCERVYNALVDKFSDSNGFEVTYVMRDETADHLSVSIVGCKNIHGTSVSRRYREYKGVDRQRYDFRLFQTGKADCSILIDEEEIAVNFRLDSASKGKFKQYFAIPAICNSVGGGKVIGLLQVACLTEQMSKSRGEIESVASMILRPYVETLLLIHKAKKAILA